MGGEPREEQREMTELTEKESDREGEEEGQKNDIERERERRGGDEIVKLVIFSPLIVFARMV